MWHGSTFHSTQVGVQGYHLPVVFKKTVELVTASRLLRLLLQIFGVSRLYQDFVWDLSGLTINPGGFRPANWQAGCDPQAGPTFIVQASN